MTILTKTEEDENIGSNQEETTKSKESAYEAPEDSNIPTTSKVALRDRPETVEAEQNINVDLHQQETTTLKLKKFEHQTPQNSNIASASAVVPSSDKAEKDINVDSNVQESTSKGTSNDQLKSVIVKTKVLSDGSSNNNQQMTVVPPRAIVQPFPDFSKQTYQPRSVEDEIVHLTIRHRVNVLNDPENLISESHEGATPTLPSSNEPDPSDNPSESSAEEVLRVTQVTQPPGPIELFFDRDFCNSTTILILVFFLFLIITIYVLGVVFKKKPK